MANFVQPSRLGQAYSGSFGADTDALFLKVFSGEVITTFEKYNVMMPLHRVRTIQSGKSATFPVTGVASAKYHTPGESVLSEATGTTLYGSTASGSFTGGTAFDSAVSPSSKYLNRFKHNEKIIYIDDVLLSSAFVADIDEMKNHYDVRSIYSTEIGRALAYTADKNLIRTVIAGARRTTDRFGGSDATLLGAQVAVNATPTGATLVSGLFSVAQKMDEAGVPADNRVAVLSPAMYYKLVSDQTSNLTLNRDYNDPNGSIANGNIFSVAGIKILKSANIPSGNESSTELSPHGDDGVKNNVISAANSGTAGYSGLNYTTTRGIVFHQEAIGTVKLMDLSMETDYIMERLGTLMLAKYAMGHNVLREECCYELIAA
jgi:hypothetical protein